MLDFKQIKNEADLDQCALLMSTLEPFTTLKIDLPRCHLALRGDSKEVYAAYHNGAFAGFVVLQLGGAFRGYIQTICMKPEFQGMGMGTALLKFSEERILREFPNVFMCVSSFNPRAQKLYYNLGFEKIGELKDYLVRGYDEYLLRKSSGPIVEFKSSPAK